MNRAYSILTVKAVQEDERIIRGTATTPKPDRVGDIVDPLGVTFTNPMPLLHQHRSTEPVGTCTFDKPTKNGITFEARLPKIEEPGPLKDRVDTAWGEIKAGLVRAVSIGFRALEYSFMDEGGIRFIASEVLELSLVTVPANADATISSIKSIDAPLLAATGKEPKASDRPLRPGVTGKSLKPVNLKPEEGTTMNATEHIAALETKQAALSASLQAIQTKVADEGRTKDESEKEESTNLKAELAQVVDELKDAREIERLMTSTAKPVVKEAIRTAEDGSTARSLAPVQIRREHPRGTGFIRLMGAKWLSQQQFRPAADIAKEMFADTPDVEMILRSGLDATNIADKLLQKTAVTPMSTSASGQSALVVAENLASEFFEMLRAATIIGRIPGLRRVPFNISVPRSLTDPTGYWVGQGDQKPVSAMTFDQVTLPFHKVAGIVPLTEELLRFSNPAAEGIIRDALIGALTYLVDRDFLDPSKVAVGVVNPSSLTYGVTPIVASGTTEAAFRNDLGDLISTYLGLNMSPAGLVLIMTSSQAMRLGLMRNSLGVKEFPDIGINGGMIEGIPVLTSENIVATGGSPTDGYPIVAINAKEILLADDGGVSIDVSREASLQMDTAPDSPETASTVLVSLWQRNMVAIKAERFITWKTGRTGAVQYIASAKYEDS